MSGRRPLQVGDPVRSGVGRTEHVRGRVLRVEQQQCQGPGVRDEVYVAWTIEGLDDARP